MAVPDAAALERYRDAMTDDEFARFARGEFGLYGGAGLAAGTRVPADLELLAVAGAQSKKWRPRRVAAFGAPGRPVILNFGSSTALTFLRNLVNFDRVATWHRERADFYYVYTDEARPSDGWALATPEDVLGSVPPPRAPRTTEERCATAFAWHDRIATDVPLLVDAVDSRACAAFAARPERLYILLEDTVVYAGEDGTYDLEDMKQHLLSFLAPPPPRQPPPPTALAIDYPF